MPVTFERRVTASGRPYTRVHPTGVVGLPEAELFVERVQPGGVDGDVPLLIVATDPLLELRSETRKILASKVLSGRRPHSATVLTRAPLRVVMGFLLRIIGNAEKMHFFSDERAAHAWLTSHSPTDEVSHADSL
ncbi:MAG: hypothetical protein JNG84_11420 [Archangium sp.]|nr:hypothetical protein [Archangium sp.]